MTREEAINKLKTLCSPEQMYALKVLVPELAESEDERIRKSIVDYISRLKPTDMWNDEFSVGSVLAWLERQKEQKPCEIAYIEDSAKCGAGVTVTGDPYSKDSMKPAEWSDEDERLLDLWLEVININGWRMDKKFCEDCRKFIERLKSIRLHPHWKPSEEQMKALKYVAYHLMPDENYREEMFSLYNELKKL